jgi:N-acetylglucosaminyldiphosphoundecaprenol N-acetyl-beta-D-mannosaminyltransferase
MVVHTMRPRLKVLEAEIDAVTMAEAFAIFERFIMLRHPALVFNVNVDICMKIHRARELQAIFHAADLVLVDGTPMMWAARFLGVPLPGRVSGSDVVPAFCQIAAERGYRIFLLGGGVGIAEGARRWLEARNPGLRVVGTYAPPFGFEKDDRENARIISAVRQAKPDVMFTAFGTPKENIWLSRFKDDLAVPVSMAVGSTFDYLAGRLKRAPMWMQRAGLEWSFRLVQEPRRLWRRYLVNDPPFIYQVLRQRLRGASSTQPQSDWSGP